MSFIIKTFDLKNNKHVPNPEITFSPKNVFLQNFRYPKPLMNYLKTIPNSMTPKLYINLLKSCKYFYSKNDLLIPLDDQARKEIRKMILAKKEPTKVKLPFKIWMTQSFFGSPNFLGYYNDMHFFKYVVRCNFKQITLWEQKLAFKEFEFLIKNGVERFDCRRTTIRYCSGTVVPIEVIFAHLKSVKYLFYTFDDETAKLITVETAKELIKVIDTSELQKLYFYLVPTVFDFKTFRKFGKETPDTAFLLAFNGGLSEEYTQKLRNYGNQVLKGLCCDV